LSVAAALAAGAYGGSDKASSPKPKNPAALSAEAQSAATGDTPGNQVFPVSRNRAAG
jgi:hypothetical protein